MSITKIAIIGAHGVGKTTLANELRSRLSGKGFGKISVAPEIPREICSLAHDPECFRRGKNNALKQALLLFSQLQYEQSFLPCENGVFICDRGVLDLWAYSKYLFGDEFQAAGVLELYETLVVQSARTYRMHFYVPAEIPPSDDGTRESDVDFQVAIDHTIRKLLVKYDVPYRKTRGSLDERCMLVEAALRELIAAQRE